MEQHARRQSKIVKYYRGVRTTIGLGIAVISKAPEMHKGQGKTRHCPEEHQYLHQEKKE